MNDGQVYEYFSRRANPQEHARTEYEIGLLLSTADHSEHDLDMARELNAITDRCARGLR